MGWVTAKRMRGLVSDAGWVAAVATLVLLPLTRSAPLGVWVAVGLMGMAGALRGHPKWGGWKGPLGVAGAISLGIAVRSLAPLGLAVLAAAGAWLTASLLSRYGRRHTARGLAPGLFAISAMGVYSTVPDTEEALVLAAVSTAVALVSLAGGSLALPLGWAPAGAGAAAAIYAWTVAAGGVGRAGSVVGAAACLGLFLADPLADLLSSERLRWGKGKGPSRWLLLALQALVAVLCGRVAGLRSGALEAAEVAVPVVAGLVVVLWLLNRFLRR